MSVGKLGTNPLASYAATAAVRPSVPPTSGSPAAPGSAAPEAAREFEALMVRQLLQELPLGLEGTQAETFSSLVYDALANQLVTAGGLGLAASIEDDLARAGTAEPTVTIRPRPTARVTSAFGLRHDPIDGSHRRHQGVDLDAPRGAPIHALRAGKVTFAGPSGGYGNVVIVDHGGGLQTRYAHCDALAVSSGDEVDAGETLGTVGDTGRATGPHLHLEVRVDGTPVDPLPWLRASGGTIP